MRSVVKLRLDLVTRAAGAPTAFHLRVLGQRVAALSHEAFDASMNSRAVVKALAGELLEIFDRFRRDVRPELNYHFAGGGFDNGNFIHNGPEICPGRARGRRF